MVTGYPVDWKRKQHRNGPYLSIHKTGCAKGTYLHKQMSFVYVHIGSMHAGMNIWTFLYIYAY